jgi:hypothetical protein
MSKKFILCYALIILAFSCRKDEKLNPKPDLSNPATDSLSLTLQQVRTWYDRQANIPAGDQSQTTGKVFSLRALHVSWDRISAMPARSGRYWLATLSGQPRFQNAPQGYRKLAFFRDSAGAIQARILEIIPDGLYFQRKQKTTTADFTGRIFVYDRFYRLLSGGVFAAGKMTGEIKPGNGKASPQIAAVHTNSMPVETCGWYDSNYVSAEGVTVVYSEKICSTTFYNLSTGGAFSQDLPAGTGDYAGTGGGGGPAPAPPPEIADLPGETKPGIQPKAYMDCFSGIPDAGASMQVTIYVQEPLPGTTFNIGYNSVGHVAIGLTKSNGSTTVTQVVGFYPDATGISKMHAPSKVVDNSNLEYNVSISYPVNSDQFGKIISYVANPPAQYDLTDFNCTNFVYNACETAGLSLPNPFNSVGIGQPGSIKIAMTPAGLGDSIEKLNGQTNVNTNGGTMPNSKGPCTN